MNQPVNAPEERRDVHLLDYWRILWRGRWTILSVFVVVVTLVAVGTFTQDPVYRATATVEISSQSRKVAPVADAGDLGVGSFGWLAEERYYNTQYEIIKSRDVAERVFDRLDLYNEAQFKKSHDPIDTFRKSIQVDPVKDTGIVEISLEGTDAKAIATWVNATAEAYVDRNLEQGINSASKAVKALLNEVKPLRERLADSQRTSFEFAEKANLYVPENQQKITNEKLSTLQEELTKTQVRKTNIESLLRQVDAVRNRGGSYETIPEISSDQAIEGLSRERVALEREYERILVTFREKHTKALEKKSEIEKVNQKLVTEAERIIGGLRSEFALLLDRERELMRAIDETRAESLRDNQKTTGYEQLRGEATEAKRIYDLISTRMKEIDISASLLSNNLRILDRSPVPNVPVKPRTVLNMAIGVLLALLLAVGTVFFMDYLDNTIRTSEDVEHFLGLSLLAVVPRDVDATHHAVKEAYQTLRMSLLFARKTQVAKTLLVTSTGPQEGKSQTIVHLARTLASGGERVIVIDCDLRRPTIHQRLQVGRDLGITNYILSTEDDLAPYIKSTSTPNLFAITCGSIPPNPAEVFGHERFTRLLNELKRSYDWVLVDSPPVISLADATILASMVDMVAFVVKHNENDKDMIRRAVNNLRRVNAALAGAVLNSVDIDRSHYKEYYYLGYYYYGEGQGRKSRRSKGTSRLKAVAGSETTSSSNRSVG
ncbi:MAG TPA: polysaccharide biosynthesis tyrosine autokinase [Candidatus Cryosericum sp.]|nr:polysaccharide biosynthesis tyrosine autokinase [Candidatus Cryosericum sp.]